MVFPPLSDDMSKSDSGTEMAAKATCSFRDKTKQVVTCLTLELKRHLWLEKTYYLALPCALTQHEA